MKTPRCVFHLSALITAVTFIVACSPSLKQRVTATLDDVETYINARPDSALAVLQAVDTTTLRTRALRARYSLLHVMALDKCYKDITTPGLLLPAEVWYVHHGTADERMKTLYYQGAIAQANQDLPRAIVYYDRAERCSVQASDTHAVGLLFEAIASIYNKTNHVDREQEYTEKALKIFFESGDPMYGSALGDLALVYHSRKEWTKADSLYREAVRHSDAYPYAKKIYLSNYARMKVLQPDKDPEGAIELFRQVLKLSNGTLSSEEAGAYAYAAWLTGEQKEAEMYCDRLRSLTGPARLGTLPWLARVAVEKKDYAAALEYQEEAHRLERVFVENSLKDSITQALYEEASRRAQLERIHRRTVVLISTLLLFVLLTILLLSMLRYWQVATERDRLIGIRERLQRELEESDKLAVESKLVTREQESRLIELEQKIAEERAAYTRERVNRLRQLGELRSTFWWKEQGSLSEAHAMKRIKEEISYVFQTDNDGRLLIRRLDLELNGAVSRLRQALKLRGKPREVLFLCLCILDLEPEMMAEIMKTTKANVYEKRSRLRAKIRALGDPLFTILVEKSNTRFI